MTEDDIRKKWAEAPFSVEMPEDVKVLLDRIDELKIALAYANSECSCGRYPIDYSDY